MQLNFRVQLTEHNQAVVLNSDNEVMYEGSEDKANEFFMHLLTDEEKTAMQDEHEVDLVLLLEEQANNELRGPN